MNREIKFRAWDESEEIMLSDVSIENDTWDMLNSFIKYTSEDLIYMQFTGLQDKNGVEIYEGDIIEFIGEKEVVTYETGEWACGCFRLAVVYGKIKVLGNKYENPELLK